MVNFQPRKAWDRIKKDKELIRHSFKKCGLSNDSNEKENALVKIKGIEGYKMPLPEKKFEMESESDDDDEDEYEDGEFEESSSSESSSSES